MLLKQVTAAEFGLSMPTWVKQLSRKGRTNTCGAEGRHWDFYMQVTLLKSGKSWCLLALVSGQDSLFQTQPSFRLDSLHRRASERIRLDKELQHSIEKRFMAEVSGKTDASSWQSFAYLYPYVKVARLQASRAVNSESTTHSHSRCSLQPLDSSRAWTLSPLTKPPVNMTFWFHGAFVADLWRNELNREPNGDGTEKEIVWQCHLKWVILYSIMPRVFPESKVFLHWVLFPFYFLSGILAK